MSAIHPSVHGHSSTPSGGSGDDLILGIEGFTCADLYDPIRLKDLADRFRQAVDQADPDLGTRYRAYLQSKGEGFSGPETSDLIVKLAPHLGRFTARLFRVEESCEQDRQAAAKVQPIFEFKRNFVIKRALKAYKADALASFDAEKLDRQMVLLEEAIAGSSAPEGDRELSMARAVVALTEIEKTLERKTKGQDVDPTESLRNAGEIFTALAKHSRAGTLLSGLLPAPEALKDVTRTLEAVRRVLTVPEQWIFLHEHDKTARKRVSGWASFDLPEKYDFFNLVHMIHPNPQMPELIEGPEETRRRRDGFALTDRRYDKRRIASEIDYCVFCHEREKDSCSKGFWDKDGKLKKNPLGIPQTGCPLDEKISEAQLLKRDGETIASLAVMMIDNPMIAATGHRICNDCMKACVYQKQDPVDIPQIETRMLTDTLALPWGFEIFSLLTRWNPLNAKRPHALPYNGKNVLVVGMGPAGFTLTQCLLTEGFGVVGIDGLKIEPLPTEWTGDGRNLPRPIRNIETLHEELDQRRMAGFGGVAEYGITVRWDKNFLRLIYLTLSRWNTFQVFGGVRFGGTFTIDDAWGMGFDHIAVATGAGRPTIVEMKNNLIRGVRKASDFLMALQLTGAARKSTMANLQVRLPAVVIGGGLTAIDTATELVAFYPVQVEKTLDRFEKLAAAFGEERVWSMYDEEDKKILHEFLEHGRAVRAERERARAAGEAPNFVPVVRSWGGVSLIYRKSVLDSPAYRLNHEEIIKSLEEGIFYVENMSPVECLADEYGAVRAITFNRQKKTPEGKWRDSGEILEFPARGVFVAAGTTPNIIYEKEWPGTFEMDNKKKFFQRFEPKWTDNAPELVSTPGWDHITTKTPALFTSYRKDGKLISFYGDNHPVFAGNVVKAMASAKKGFPYIVKLFEKETANLDPAGAPKRMERFRGLADSLREGCRPTVHKVVRLTPTIVEVVVKAPFQARHFRPGQFYRLQNYEARAEVIEGTHMTTEGMALTGAWVDRERGLLSMIALELGHSSRLCASLKEGEPVVVMGPTGCPTEIPEGGETVLLAGGGLGNAVLFSIGKALRDKGNKVIYFAGYKKPRDVYKLDEIEAAADVIVWSVDVEPGITPRRPQDKTFVGNIVQSMKTYAEGGMGETTLRIQDADRIIAIGSDRMMAAVKAARFGVLKPFLNEGHIAVASINSPMQCMMKEVCAQCLQRHVDPKTGAPAEPVFTCFNQDQEMDEVDFPNLNARLKQNSVPEKISNLWLDYLLQKKNIIRV